MLRVAQSTDIPQIQIVRNLVKENMLSNPALVSDADCDEYINRRGKGWVYEIDNKIVGFSIVDLQDNNVWALFVDPDYEKLGIGRKLHDVMLNWYFSQTNTKIWLGTAPFTRAADFYRIAGWLETGTHGIKEIKFEMTFEKWTNKKKMTDKNSITSIRTFTHSIAKVYRAWSDPDYLKQWWGPAGFTNTFHIHDLKPGGRWSFIMHGPDGRDFPNECVFIDIKPNEYLSWDHQPNPKFQVQVNFEEEVQGSTKVIFKMIFDTEKEADSLRSFILEKNEENFVKLDAVLEKM